MKTRNPLRSLASAALLATLAACGGSDGPSNTQTAIGTITAFGSVVVNGIRFDDAAASITMDGAAATRDRLRVGMRVQVRGRIRSDGTGTADSIVYEDCLQGPITAMNRVENTVTVLGQLVQLDDGTVFDGVALRDANAFAIGDMVEVSCMAERSRQRLRATRMERLGPFQNGVSELELKGTVAALDMGAGTFRLGDLVVNFGAMGMADRPAGLANGMAVEVSGRGFASGVLTADRLRDRDRDRISHIDGDGLEIEGYVSDFVSISSFRIDGQAVNAADAVIRNGTAADIRDGLKVEAEGTLSGDVLMASVLVVKRESSVRVEAGLQARDTALGTITLLGQVLKLGAGAELRDRLASATQPAAITLADLAAADRLEVNAYEDATGALIALRIERTEPDALVVVKGAAGSKQPVTQLTLSGFQVATGANTRYRDASGSLVDATSFYAAVLVPPAGSTRVHARGVVAGLATSVLDATRSASSTGEVEIAGP